MQFLAVNISMHQASLSDKQPIFELKVSLESRKVQFDPPVGMNDSGKGIRDIINNVVNDFTSLAVQMIRVDTGQGDYLIEIKD